MKTPNISVLMSTYKNDKAEHLSKAIDSVLKQTLKPAEIVIVIDGEIPKPNKKLLEEYKKTYGQIRTIELKKNMGLGLALRRGLQECKYDIIARMDSDDISRPDRLELEYRALSAEDADIVGSNITEFIDEEGNIISKRKVPETDNSIKQYLKTRCPMNHMTVMFKKQSVLNAGGYEDFKYNEDYILWIKMYEKNMKFYNIQDTLVNVRVGKDMYARRGGIEYYRSEKAIQKYLRGHKIINHSTYISNCAKRFIVQVLVPSSLRGVLFRKFARSSASD